MFNTVERVNELAEEKNMSVSMLCRLSGVNYSTLRMANIRNTQLSVDTIERLCAGMHITFGEFFNKVPEGYEKMTI